MINVLQNNNSSQMPFDMNNSIKKRSIQNKHWKKRIQQQMFVECHTALSNFKIAC